VQFGTKVVLLSRCLRRLDSCCCGLGEFRDGRETGTVIRPGGPVPSDGPLAKGNPNLTYKYQKVVPHALYKVLYIVKGHNNPSPQDYQWFTLTKADTQRPILGILRVKE
jgi:hypothetical protein